MDFLIYAVSTFSKSLILYFFTIKLFSLIHGIKLNMKKKLSIVSILISFSIFIEFYSVKSHNTLYFMYIVPLLIIYLCILKKSCKKSIIHILLSEFIILLSETISFLFINIYNKFSISKYTASTCHIYERCILTFILSVLIFKFVYKFINTNKDVIINLFENIGYKEIFLFAGITLLPAFSLVVHFNYNIINFEAYMFISLIALCYIIVKYSNRYINFTNELSQSEKLNKNLTSEIDKLKLIKHDFDNILNTINGYITLKKYDELENHIKNIIKQSKQQTSKEYVNPCAINQPAVYGIVDSKYATALEKNIKFDIDVNTNIQEINFDFLELSKVLGILLDNAIEASQQTESKEISITFEYNNKKQADLIEIKNSIKPNLNININKIFEKGESSKKEKSGLGLWEVKKIISSNNNSQIYTNINDDIFSQTIVIEKA